MAIRRAAPLTFVQDLFLSRQAFVAGLDDVAAVGEAVEQGRPVCCVVTMAQKSHD